MNATVSTNDRTRRGPCTAIARAVTDRSASYSTTDRPCPNDDLAIGLDADVDEPDTGVAKRAEHVGRDRIDLGIDVGETPARHADDDVTQRPGPAGPSTCDHLIDQPGVGHGAGVQTDGVSRPGEVDHPVTGIPPRRRPETDNPAERGRNRDRTAGVRAEAGRDGSERDGRGAAAAGPARDPVPVERVADRPERGIVGRDAKRKLMHVRLADDDRTRLPKDADDTGVDGRRRIAQQRATGGGRQPSHVDIVFDRDRQASQFAPGRPSTAVRPG